MDELYLGIDIGTSSTKAIIINTTGGVAGFGKSAYSTLSPRLGWAEQEPETWCEAVKDSVQAALSQLKGYRSIRGIGMTGQMHGLVMLDMDLKPLVPAILWPDTRAGGQVQRIKGLFGESLFEITGGPTATGFLLASLLWVRENWPDIYRKIHVVLNPKDYVRLRLTGKMATEPTDACGTGAFSPAASRWAYDIIESLGLKPEFFPEVLPSSSIAGVLSNSAAAYLGLEAKIPVVAGCGDLQASAMGIGITHPGQLLVNIGTRGQVFQLLNHYAFDPHGRLHTMVHADGSSWHAMGAMLAAGLSMSWIVNIIGANETAGWAHLFELSSDVVACEEGLYFLPYLSGERTPHMNERLSGSFWGLRSEHGRSHLFRAVLEGVAFALRDCFCTLSTLTEYPTVIRAGSGGLKDTCFRQVIADVFGMPLEYTDQPETSGIGAALLAQACVTGQDLQDLINASVKTTGVIQPDMDRHQVYEKGFRQYCQLAQAAIEILQ